VKLFVRNNRKKTFFYHNSGYFESNIPKYVQLKFFYNLQNQYLPYNS
jgi:hypothetical protein